MKDKSKYIKGGQPILSWAEEDRPREKMIQKGKSALTEVELLAILIGSGTQSLSAVDVARKLMLKADQNLNELARLDIKQLTAIKGIGIAKAVTIASAFELGRRRRSIEINKKVKIGSSNDIYELMQPELQDQIRESFWIILMNRANHLIKKIEISRGGVSGTVADPKLIFKYALDHVASSIILVHNHPSGNTKPSEADIRLTKKLKQSGETMEIQILDHIIYTDRSYLSFADEGLL